MNLLFVFLLLFFVRLTSVFLVKTFYVPDEYWQSLEVAHKLTFGYGYLTWEWVQGIRSYVYPLAIAAIYKLLALLNLDTARQLVVLPRILQATLSAYSDYRFFVWSGKKKWALFIISVPYFWFYTGSRTLSNTLETSLTTIALSYFPWHGEGIAYLWPAALCCFLRPTAVLIWLPLIVLHLRKSQISWSELVFKRFLIIGFAVAAICVAIDSWMHGQILVTPYQFLKYNIFNNIGSFYGAHPWHWYFTIGLPAVLGVNIIPFLQGVVETVRHHEVYVVRKYLLITILISLSALSIIEHKEFRFISALMPLCLYIAADSLTRWSYKASSSSLWFTAYLLLLGNVLPAWYLSMVHQKGPLDVMDKLHDIAVEYRDEHNRSASILFLMPCHSTPFYSHIHQNVTMRFLTCEPNLKQLDNYIDEAEEFFSSPDDWLRSHIPSYPKTAKPSHVVMYEQLEPFVHEFLRDYKELYRIENGDSYMNIQFQIVENIWPDIINEKPSIVSFVDYMKERNGKSILVFQRLRSGEENAFNREEVQKQNEELMYPKLDASNGEDRAYSQETKNFFNEIES